MLPARDTTPRTGRPLGARIEQTCPKCQHPMSARTVDGFISAVEDHAGLCDPAHAAVLARVDVPYVRM